MFNKRLTEEVDELHYTLHFVIDSFEAKIAKLERIIVEAGLVKEYKGNKIDDTLFNLNGTFYTLKKGK